MRLLFTFIIIIQFFLPIFSARIFIENYNTISIDQHVTPEIFGWSIDVIYFDGSLQLVVGDPYYSGYGGLHILWLEGNGTIRKRSTIEGFGVNYGMNFGSAVAAYRDLDGNGVAELLVGAAADDVVWLLYLDRNGTVMKERRISALDVSAPMNCRFGSDIAVIGDLNGDRISEIVIGSPNYESNKGAVWIVWLNKTGIVIKSQQISLGVGEFDGELPAQDLFGTSVSVIPDLDRDRVPELAVGSPGSDNRSGKVWILFLKSDGTVKRYQEIGSNQGDFNYTLPTGGLFGTSLTWTSDLNNDRTPELVVGCASDSIIPVPGGSIWMLYLNRDGTVKDQQHIYQGETSSGFNTTLSDRAYFGQSVAFVPGNILSPYSRLIVGAPGDPYSILAGAVYDMTIFAYCETNLENECLSPCFNPLNDPYRCNILSDITDTSLINKNVSINNVTVFLEAEINVGGDVDVNASFIDISSFFKINGTFHTTHNSVLEFQRNGSLVIGGCIDFEENTALFLNLTDTEKLETGSFLLATTASEDCLLKQSQLPKTTCKEGFQEKFKYKKNQLQVIYSTCLTTGQWILVIVLSTAVIAGFLGIVIYFTPLRKILLPYRRPPPQSTTKTPYRSQPMGLN